MTTNDDDEGEGTPPVCAVAAAEGRPEAEAIANAVRSPLDRAHLNARGSHKPTYPVVDRSRVGIAAPADYDPGNVKGEDPAATSARAALGILHKTWAVVGEVAGDRSIPAADLARTATAAIERALRQADRAVETIALQVAHAEKQLQSKIAPEIDGTLASEIRAWSRDLNPRDRVGKLPEILAAVKTDVRAASALLSAPPFISSLADDQVAAVRQTAISTHARAEGEKLKQAQRAADLVARASRRLLDEMAPRLRQWSGPTSPLERLEQLGKDGQQ
jgi:hypothetical protein